MKTFINFTSKFFIKPMENGIIGFLVFFLVVECSKYFAYIIGSQETFKIENDDFLLSLIGFVLFFLIRLLENFKDEKNQVA